MGQFDSLLITCQNEAVEVQTKALGESLDSFRPGDRLVPALQAPGWKVFVDDFHLDNRWTDPWAQRLLVVLTWDGVWLDHGLALPHRRDAVTRGLMDVWSDPRYAAWAHGRWAQWFADVRTRDEQAWNDQWRLLQDWQGGLAHHLRRTPATAPLGPLDRDEVTTAMERSLAARRQGRLHNELTWPALIAELPEEEDPNGQLFDPVERGFFAVPQVRNAATSRWSMAATALLAGDWHAVESLVNDERPATLPEDWQHALDTTLAGLMPSLVLQPYARRLLTWGARPPVEVQGLPLPQWAAEEQGWDLPLLEALRTAGPGPAWADQWPLWGYDGYQRAWAQRAPGDRWPVQDVTDWLVRCANQPTPSMATLPEQPWLAAGGRLSAESPERDPLAIVLARPHGVSAAYVRWLIEHRDRAGWQVKHLPELTARLQEHVRNETSPAQDWNAVWVVFEKIQLKLCAPRTRRPKTAAPVRKRL